MVCLRWRLPERRPATPEAARLGRSGGSGQRRGLRRLLPRRHSGGVQEFLLPGSHFTEKLAISANLAEPRSGAGSFTRDVTFVRGASSIERGQLVAAAS